MFHKMLSSLLDQSTPDDPLLLKGVSKTDFVAFLKLICPKSVSINQTVITCIYTLDTEIFRSVRS